MERNGMGLGKFRRLGNTAVFLFAFLLISNKAVNAQTLAYDLASDWSLSGAPLKGMPFGPDGSWGVYSVQLKPDGSWAAFDRAMHFTVSNPWLELYGIDGWWLGGSPVARKPMVGKNTGQGNIPGKLHGTYYDWPPGRVAACEWPESDHGKAASTVTAVVWTSPQAMEVGVTGAIWTVGQYPDVAERRTRLMMWIERASSVAGDAIVFRDVLIPLWTEGYDSGHPETFAQILGDRAWQLEKIQVEKGDRIAVGFYWDDTASKPGLSGIDFRVLEQSATK
jgi:hypothetical protein